MRTLVAAILLASLIGAGCDAANPASPPPQPLGSSAELGASPGSADPAASMSGNASPSPIASRELAARFSDAETKADRADREAYAIWRESSKDLDAAKARSRRYARATLTFLETIRELSWPPDLEPLANRLVKCHTTVYAYQKKGSDGKGYKTLSGLAAVKKYDRLAGRMGAKCSVLATMLRRELGLGPPGVGPDAVADADPPRQDGDPVLLLTAGLGCYAGGEHPATAELVADAEYGTTFNGHPVVWPLGFIGRRAGSEVEVLDRDGNVRATTGRRYWIAPAAGDPYDIDAFPAAVDCGYPWDFGQCDPNDEPALRAGISAAEHEESRAAYC